MKFFINKQNCSALSLLVFMLLLLVPGCKKNELTLPPVDNVSPGGFSSLSLTPGNGSVTVNWDRLTDTDIDYVLVRFVDSTANSKNELLSRRFARDRNQIIINNLQNFKDYEFTFIVVDKYGNTSDSVLANAIPVAEILNIFAKGGEEEGSVDITWEDPVDNFGAFTGIAFYEGDRLLGEFVRGVETASFQGLTPGEDVIITAKVKLSDGRFSTGVEFVVKSRVILPPPGEVTNFQVKSKTNLLELIWNNPTDENFSFVEIYWGIGNAREHAITHFLGKIDTLHDGRMKVIIPGLVNNTDYAVVIKTSDDQGNSSEGIFRFAQPVNTTFIGNVNIASQQDADAFNSSITYIQGNLRIENAANLTNLANLRNLDSISGLLMFKSSPWSYIEMDDFQNLQKIGGDLTFESVWTSANITLPSLRRVEGNFLVRYTNLTSIKAPQLEFVGMDMYFLSLGTSFREFDFMSLNRIGARLLFADIPNLTSLDGFTALRHVGSHFIVGRDPWGAGSKYCGIKSYCGVQTLMQSGHIGGDVIIESAAYTPSRPDIVAGRCAQ